MRALATGGTGFAMSNVVARDAEADVSMDPEKRLERWNTCVIDRILHELEWRSSPFAEQLASYLRWVADDPQRRFPRLERV